jgi:hypothetical protein
MRLPPVSCQIGFSTVENPEATSDTGDDESGFKHG